MVLKGLTIWVNTRIPAGGAEERLVGRVWPGGLEPPQSVGVEGTLTQASPDKGKEQCEEDVGPVPLMLGGHGDYAQEEEDEGLRDGGQHLNHVADGGARALGHVLLHVVLHGDGAGDDAAQSGDTRVT